MDEILTRVHDLLAHWEQERRGIANRPEASGDPYQRAQHDTLQKCCDELRETLGGFVVSQASA